MINIKNLEIEYITALIFGIMGFILSLFLGFISGNKITLLLIRSLIITTVFSMIGYACLIVIKKFVPEIYQVFGSINENKEIDLDKDPDSPVDSSAENTENMPAGSTAEVGPGQDQKISDMELENEFNTLEKESSKISTDRPDSDIISKDISSEKNIKYEPKIAAQAIRTMMKRDE